MGTESISSDNSETPNNNGLEISLDPGGDEKCLHENGEGVKMRAPVHVTKDSYSSPRSGQCGLFSWRPACLQPCASLPSFTVFMSALSLFGAVNFSHFTAVISQIERQYGFSSSVSGVVKNIDNVGFLIAVLLYSHFCRHSNKPRLLAITNVVASLAICCCALPHFIFKPGDPVLEPNLPDDPIVTHINSSDTYGYNMTSWSRDSRKYEYCDGVGEEEDTDVCGERSLNVGALVILLAAGLIQGAARPPQATLSLTYMDDTSPDASPKYFGFIFGSRSLAPVLGFLLGAWCTSIYVDLSDPGITQTDPRWVGAWWIGFLICGGATIIWSFPLMLFPMKIPNTPKKHRLRNRKGENDITLQEIGKTESLLHNGSKVGAVKPDVRKTDDVPDMSGDFVDNMKDLPRALCRLLRNPIFLFSIMGACCNMSLLGFITFLSKYIEMQFRQSPSMSNIYTGCISAFAFSVGPILSGRVISRFKISAKKSLKLMTCVQVLSLAGFVGMTLMGCPQAEWAGDPFRTKPANWSQPCNEDCVCDVSEFSPVCGTDGYNYYSPCYAGCTGPENVTEKTFAGCDCVPSPGQAVIGRCDPYCIMMIPYLLVLGVTSFVTSMFIVPLMTVLLRCVEERDKALSVALGTAFVNFAAFPAPIIYGLVVDSTCLVKQTTCGVRGACLFNNPTDMRYWLHGLEVIFKVMALVFFGLALFKSRNATFTDDCEISKEEATIQSHAERRLTSTSSMSM